MSLPYSDRICDGVKDPKVVLQEQVLKYRQVFEEAMRQVSFLGICLVWL